MHINIETLTESELIALNHRIVTRLRELKGAQTKRQLKEFTFGDYVVFTKENGDPIEGMVVLCLKSTVTIIDDDEQHWKVSPGLLNKIKVPRGFVPKPIAELDRIIAQWQQPPAKRKSTT